MPGNHIHRTGTFLLSGAMAVLGAALIVRVIADGGGVFSVGLLVGVLFLAAGCGRVYVEVRKGRGT